MDRDTIFKITVALILLTILYTFVRFFYRQRVLKQLGTLLYSNDIENYRKRFDSKSVKFLLTPIERQLFTLDEGFLTTQEDLIRSTLNQLDNFRLNDQQKGIVHSKAFYFFTSLGEIESAKHYYALLLNNKSYPDKYNLKRAYNTYIEKGYEYLEETIKQAQSNPTNYAIIADMYHNKGDTDNHKKYTELFKKYMDSQWISK